jgi:hypothetical protein
MKKLTLGALALLCFGTANAQGIESGTFTGNMESIFQYLRPDPIIDAEQPAEKGLLNSYMNVFYRNGGFKAGMRLESYLPRILGYPNQFDGTGIGMRYVGYENDFIDVTLGSIYEQFGSGMILRTYEDRALGYDNFIDGARVIVKPYKGVTFKGVYGYQRLSFQSGKIVHADGIVRGFDGQVHLNSLIKPLEGKQLDVTLGGSFVSKFQRDNRDDLILPENVGSYGGRFALRYKRFTLDGEYIIKEQDPSTDNGYIYNYGHAAVFNFGYTQKGLGIMFTAKSVDNMSYRSDRTQVLQDVLINYLPAVNKVHTYNLVSSLYPWATQPVGEIAYQGEVLYKVKRGTKLGGKYGTSINFNASFAMRPNRSTDNIDVVSGLHPIEGVETDIEGSAYSTGIFDHADLNNFDYVSDEDQEAFREHYGRDMNYTDHRDFFWQDINVNIYRKFSKKFNLRLSYFNIMMNNDVNKVTDYAHGPLKTNIGVIEAGYKINKKHSLRFELQGLFINKVYEEYDQYSFYADADNDIIVTDTTTIGEKMLNDKGNWLTVLVEYNVSPHWFFSVMNQYNLTNAKSVYQLSKYDGFGEFDFNRSGINHVYVSVGYIQESTRVTVGYGRQRAGLFCVGGVCRVVPASNGLTLSITQSF